MSTNSSLTARQSAFVREFLISRNQTEAFIKAGYSAKTARVNAARMMTKDNIRAAISEGEAAAAKRAQVSLDDIVAQYVALGMTGMSRFIRIDNDGQPVVDLSRCTQTDLDALSEITIDTYKTGGGEEAREVRRIRIKRHDRFTALAKLANYVGMDKGAEEINKPDSLTLLLKEIQERGSALPVKPQGPLGSKGKPWKN